MSYRIAPRPESTSRTPPMKSPTYLDFIRTLPCVVTGCEGVQAAHVSYAAPEWAAEGRGAAQKAHDSFALPLTPEQHELQHSGKLGGEADYWRSVGINPHHVCRVLFSIWNENKHTAHARAVKFLARVRTASEATEDGLDYD